MPYNGSGTFTLIYNWPNDAANAINITASRMQGQDADMATGLSDCVTRDGQSTWTANLPAGGFVITGLGAGAGAGQSVRYEQVMLLSGANTMTGTLPLVAGTTSVAPLTFTAGTNLTAATAGSMEWDGTNAYLTQTTGPTRKTLAFTDSTMSGNTTGSAAKLTTARSIAMSGDVVWTVNFDGSAGVTAAGTIQSGAVTGSKIAASTVANSNLATMSDQRIKGNVSGSTAVPSDLTAAQVLTMLGVTTSGIGSSGYIILPGGLYVQWKIGTTDPANNTGPNQTVTFPIAFPTACFVVLASIDIASIDSGCDCWYQTVGWSTSSATILRQVAANASNSVTTRPIVVAIGN